MQRLLGPADQGGHQAGPGARRPFSGQSRVLRGLFPYVWPSDRPDLQRTVVVSLVLMLLAKLVTVAMPFTFKWATDALVAVAGGAVPVDADAALARRRAGRRHLFLRAGAHRHVAARAGARGAVRYGRHARRAQAGAGGLRAHASPVAALPSRAQDRRAPAPGGATAASTSRRCRAAPRRRSRSGSASGSSGARAGAPGRRAPRASACADAFARSGALGLHDSHPHEGRQRAPDERRVEGEARP